MSSFIIGVLAALAVFVVLVAYQRIVAQQQAATSSSSSSSSGGGGGSSSNANANANNSGGSSSNANANVGGSNANGSSNATANSGGSNANGGGGGQTTYTYALGLGGDGSKCPAGFTRVTIAQCQALQNSTVSLDGTNTRFGDYAGAKCAAHYTPGEGCFVNRNRNKLFATTAGCTVNACKNHRHCYRCVDHPDGHCPTHKKNGGCSMNNPHWQKWRTRCPVTCGVCKQGSAYLNAGRKKSKGDDTDDPVAIDCGDTRPGKWGNVCARACGLCTGYRQHGHRALCAKPQTTTPT